MLSSVASCIDPLLRRFVYRSSEGKGGGEDEGDILSHRRDWRDLQLEGVLLCGVSVGEGRS